MLAGNRFLPSFDVEKLGLAVDPLELKGLWIYPLALHLTSDNRSFKGNDAQVVSVCRFYDDEVSGLYALSRSVLVDSLAGVLETDLEIVVELLLVYSFKPVIYLELAAASAIGAFHLTDIVPFYLTAA